MVGLFRFCLILIVIHLLKTYDLELSGIFIISHNILINSQWYTKLIDIENKI